MKKPVAGLLLVLILAAGPALSAQQPESYAAALLIESEPYSEAGGLYTSTQGDTSGVAAVGKSTVVLTQAKVVVSGASSNDEVSSLWGTNAGVLASGGAWVTMTGGSIKTSGAGASAVFSTGASTVDVSNLSIVTTKDSSRGLAATFGGIINAKDLSITTSGAQSPAVAARQAGTVIVSGGTMKTSGEGSPGLSSAGDLRVTGAALVASGSEAAVIEGPNSITVKDTILVGAKKSGVLFQPTVPDDPGTGTGVFSMTGGSLTALAGPLLYATARAVVSLKQVTAVQTSGELARIAADLTLNAEGQTLAGDLVVESVGSLSMNLKAGSTWTGASDMAKTAKAVNLSLEGGSVWTVTADSRLNVLKVEGGVAALGKTLISGGHTVWYKTAANAWLGGKTVALDAGGSLQPY